VLKEAKKK